MCRIQLLFPFGEKVNRSGFVTRNDMKNPKKKLTCVEKSVEARIGDWIYNDVKSVSKIIGVQKSFEQL